VQERKCEETQNNRKKWFKYRKATDYNLNKEAKMPNEVTLQFEQEDAGLNLTGTVNFPNALNIQGISVITIRGLGEWRHAPANILHLNEQMIGIFNMPEKSKNLTKIGMNWIGIKAHSNILVSHTVRVGRNGTKKVQEQLTKFFKAIGASSVKFSILDVDRAIADQNSPDNSDSDW
jgi:hypothetical protein